MFPQSEPGISLNGPSGQRAHQPDGQTSLARPRVLVVEDEVLLSIEITQILSEAGFNVIGPARAVARALELVERAACRAAVLDVRLQSGTSEHVAQELKDRGMPFVTISGYAPSQLPPVFQDAPFIAKPFAPDTLVAELRRCIAQL